MWFISSFASKHFIVQTELYWLCLWNETYQKNNVIYFHFRRFYCERSINLIYEYFSTSYKNKKNKLVACLSFYCFLVLFSWMIGNSSSYGWVMYSFHCCKITLEYLVTFKGFKQNLKTLDEGGFIFRDKEAKVILLKTVQKLCTLYILATMPHENHGV